MKTFINYLNQNKIESIMKTIGTDKVWVIPGTEKDELSFCGLGKLHREDGPALEYHNGSKNWYIDGKLHREDGPACEWHRGSIEWYKNNKRIKPDIEMMSKYIRLNPENIFKDYKWPKEMQALAIELGGDEIKDRLIKEKKIHPTLIIPELDKLDNRGFFN